MKLVIVESPSKTTPIQRYLGDNEYKVVASKGHLTELTTSGPGGLGIDVEHGFVPSYKIIKSKKETVEAIQKDVSKASEVILASDHDREGEAIAWHYCQVFHLDPKKTKRILFNEVTEEAIKKAINSPTTIDDNLVSAQEARRMLDRIIGFKLSTLLNKKIHARSAGRVQSATLRLICDRQEEIDNFVSEEYYTLDVEILLESGEIIKCNLEKIDGKKASIKTKEENDAVIKELSKPVILKSYKEEKKLVSPKTPLETSSLQQVMNSTYGMSSKKISALAQKLYEGVKIGEEQVGLITYIRVDSQTYSQTFVNKAKAFINDRFGEQYVSSKIKKVNIPEGAHEPIRPTSLKRTPESIKQYLTSDEYKLYKVVYETTLASLMADKIVKKQTAEIEIGNLLFKVEGKQTIFDGFEKILSTKEKDNVIPSEIKTSHLKLNKYDSKLQYTQPPSQYSEASIIKKMRDLGIGRPSTYSPTISTLLDPKRDYLKRNSDGTLNPTDKGMYTVKMLKEYFPKFVDTKFTADMELELDDISSGKTSTTEVLSNFYPPFVELVNEAETKMKKVPIQTLDKTCPKCGAKLVIKKGKYGDFTTCSNYPSCDYVEKEINYTGEMCPQCGRPLVIKGRGRKKFIGCSGYPECKYIKHEERHFHTSNSKICPKCGGQLVEKKGRYGKFLGCSNYPKCHYQERIYKK